MKAIAKTAIVFAAIVFALPVLAGPTEDLFKAVQEGTVSEVKTALEAGANLDARDKDGWTPLHFAAAAWFGGNLEVVMLLIKAGANPNAMNKNGLTPLHEAAIDNGPEVVELLLEAGANPGARTIDGFTPFDYAKWNEALQGTEAYRLLNDGQYE